MPAKKAFFVALLIILAPSVFAAETRRTLLILKSNNLDDMHATITALKDAGIHPAHVIPPRVVIADMPVDAEQYALAISNVASVHTTSVAPSSAAKGTDLAVGIAVWNYLLTPKAAGPLRIPSQAKPLVGDAFEPPRPAALRTTEEALSSNPPGPSSHFPGLDQTSEFMAGSVAVGIILPESNEMSPNTENWTTERQTEVFNKIVEGLDWWVTKGGNSANLTFYYDQKFSVPTKYEPIMMNGTSDESIWVADIFNNMDYTSGNQYDRARAYINDLRTAFGTDWCYAIIVADSLNDADGLFANSQYFAWAYLGGPYVIMTYDNDGWDISRMNLVAAHETGHIFLAGDEYCQPGYSCCDFGYYGYLHVYNGNCENGNPSSVPCMMKYNSDAICQYTNGQIGWRDTDSDGKPDTTDNIVNNTLTPCPTPTTQTILTFTGNAADVPCDSPDRTDVTINRISAVKYSIDGGTWSDACAVDDAFDEDIEDYTFTTPPLTGGTHHIETQAWSTSGNASAVSSQDVIIGITLLITEDTNAVGCYGPGDEITYAISYSYPYEPNSEDINDVNIIDHLPEGVTFISADSNGIYDSSSRTVTWNIGTLEPNKSGRVTLTAKVNESIPGCGVITNFCEIKSSNLAYGGTYEDAPVCRASNPRPSCGGTGNLDVNKPRDINLLWCKGLFAADVNGHDVYFGTNFYAVNEANSSWLIATGPNDPNVHKGRQSATTWSARGLAPYTTYFWRIDEVNQAGPDPCIWPGPIWSFTTGLFIENFDEYASSANLSTVWRTNLLANSGCGSCTICAPGGTLQLDQTNGQNGTQAMILDYNNTGQSCQCFSETRYTGPAAGVDWTAGGSKILHISYLGRADNSADPCFDRMYVMIADANTPKPNFGLVYYNPDPNAQQKTCWHEWNIKLTDLNTPKVNLKKVRYLWLGLGLRCNPYGSSTPGGSGQVTFDNIRLEKSCGLTADFTGDCEVNMDDLRVLSEEWLRCGRADLYPDCIVDFRDFAALAEEWLKEAP
jgi:hypothetical protein